MRTFTNIVVTVLALALLADSHALPLDWEPQPSAFGDADRDGTLVVTDDLRTADFGGGLRLPVRWVYHSSDQSGSPYGWDGFSLAMLEATAVKRSSVLYEVVMLGGRVVYFNKEAGESNNWKSNDHQWSGVEDIIPCG